MPKYKKAQAYLEKAHADFLNQHARASSSKIQTKKYIKPANVHQKQFVKSMKQNEINIGSGCAGTGKTLLALFTGVQLINNSDSPISKIIYVRANVDDKEEKEIGALPGDLFEKVRHLAHPILDNLHEFIDEKQVEYLLTEDDKIEVLPLMMMRGRSFNDKFIIVDEAQNIAPSSMKTILTRAGETSKLVIIGDPRQCDIDPMKNGLIDLEWRLAKKLEHCERHDIEPEVSTGLVHFNRDDILRSRKTRFALDMYDLH